MDTTGRRIDIRTADGSAEAYVAAPDDDGAHPGVLLFMDAFGLRPQIERMAERIAAWGYVVLAPNVFYRSGTAADLTPSEDLREPGVRERFFRQVAPVMAAHSTQRAARDLDAYVAALQALPGVQDGPIGVTGYCMGGRLALRAAAQRPDLVAAAGMFHAGGLVTEQPDSPHRSIPAVRGEVLAGYADHDRSMPSTAIAVVDEALRAAGVPFTTAVYPGAAHGYTMADTSAYDEASAERHYAELHALFQRRLG